MEAPLRARELPEWTTKERTSVQEHLTLPGLSEHTCLCSLFLSYSHEPPVSCISTRNSAEKWKKICHRRKQTADSYLLPESYSLFPTVTRADIFKVDAFIRALWLNIRLLGLGLTNPRVN